MQMNIEQVIRKTASLPERINNKYYSYSEDICPIAEEIWRHYSTGGSSPELFDILLKNDGVTKQQVLSELKVENIQDALKSADNTWITTSDAILSAYEDGAEDDRCIIQSFGELVVECFRPFVKYIVNEVLSSPSFSDWPITREAVVNYGNQYNEKIIYIAGDAMLTLVRYYFQQENTESLISTLNSNDYNSFFKWFTKTGIQLVYDTYPMLIKIMCETAKRHVDNFYELLHRLMENIECIKQTFDIPSEQTVVVNIQGNLSDPHHGGKSVQCVCFKNGSSVYYKPRSMSIDVTWYRFLSKCKGMGMPGEFYHPAIVDCGDYGFMEKIEHIPCNDDKSAKEYYYNAGVLCCIVSMLGGTDFHHENIIARGSTPVLIDVETLLTPIPKALYGLPSIELEENATTRAGRTLMLQHWVGDKPSAAREIGGFTSALGEATNIQTNSFREAVGAEHYREEFIDGFAAAYDFLLENRESILENKMIDAFAECKLRYVFRRTAIYYSLIRHFLSARYLRDARYFEGACQRFGAGILLNFFHDDSLRLWNIVVEERRSARLVDIPYFVCRGDSRDLSSESDVCVAGFFEASPIELAKSNLRSMTKENKEQEVFYIGLDLDLCKEQKQFDNLTPLLSYSDVKRSVLHSLEFDDSTVLKKVEDILELCRRFELPDREYEYYAPVRNRKTTRYNLEVLPSSIYSGNLGIMLAHAAYAKLTKDDTRHKRICAKLFDMYKSEYGSGRGSSSLDIGFAQGVAGFIQTLILTAQIVNDQSLIDLATKTALAIPEENIVRTKQYDFFGGLAGLLYYCCKLYRIRANADLKQLIEHITGKLLDCAKRNGEEYQGLWKNEDEYQPLTGLAHGQSGIAMGLLSAWSILDDSQIINAAKSALAYENASYCAPENNWYDYRRFHVKIRDTSLDGKYHPRFMHGYCSGSPGIGLSRIICSSFLTAEEFEKDIDRAISYCRSGSIIGNDSLCCGSCGWIDFLVEASRYKGDEELFSYAKRLCNSIDPLISKHPYILSGFHSTAEISLFKGITGVAYQMMRLLSPDEIPSIIK